MNATLRRITVSVALLGIAGICFGQTTGKVSGRVVDAGSGQGLFGANVLIEGTSMGAVTADDGSFYVINVPPGTYDVRVTMMGFETVRMAGVRVSVNRTTPVDFQLKQTVLQSSEVVVIQAQKVAIKKDQTGSIRNVSSEEINALPVEDISAVVSMQAGIVAGHFRGGRFGEVSYLVDGMQVDNAFNRSRSVDIEKEAIQDLEVITGTFNAEYGKAMSGMVNVITKEGGNAFHGSVGGGLGNYLTPHKDTFIGLQDDDFDRRQDFKVQLEGPIIKNRLSFFANYRQEDNTNQFNGIYRYNVDDYSDFSVVPLLSMYTGDSSIVPMSWNKNKSFIGKLTYKTGTFKTFVEYTRNHYDGKDYDHLFKYNPYGKPGYNGYTDWVAFLVNHMFMKNAFYEFKGSMTKSYNGYYLFKDPGDSGWVADTYLSNDNFCGFYTGGQEKTFTELNTDKYDGKLDVTWQVSRHHSLKGGVQVTRHRFDNLSSAIRNRYFGTPFENPPFNWYDPVLAKDSTIYADVYMKEPMELSGYLQDKMEFNEMVINVGLRYDYFDPKTVYPTNWRNPDNGIKNTPESEYKSAEAKYMLSPRFGLSYQLGRAALLHFGYGHFFQAPGFNNMYANHWFLVQPVSFQTAVMGNPQLKAEKTVNYEVGLWQQLNANMGLEVTLFYKDIYELLTAGIQTTYTQIRYGRYDNKDYGNVRGLEVKYDFNYNELNGNVNYTLQYTRGVADNPLTTYNRAGNNQDPIPRLIPLEWDQRHTLNVTLGYNARSFDATVTGWFGSGLAYTYTPIAENRLSRVNLYPNNSKRPTTFTVDFYAQVRLGVAFGTRLRLTLNVYNVLDRMNELYVNGQTGRANQAILRPVDYASHRSDFNTLEDRYWNPGSFSAPRLVKLGLGIEF
jgi:outer membrane receptor protein involved in Fe transport